MCCLLSQQSISDIRWVVYDWTISAVSARIISSDLDSLNKPSRDK